MKKIAELINESTFNLMEDIDEVLADYDLILVANEDKEDYEESLKDGNSATIYGCVYFDIEDRVKEALTNMFEEIMKISKENENA